MRENSFRSRMDEQSSHGLGIKQFFAVTFLTIGFLIACWIALNIYSMFTNPQSLTAFQQLVSGNLESTAGAGDAKVKLVLPPEILAYIVPILLLAIASSIASGLITAGVGLMDDSLKKLLNKINKAEIESDK